MKRTKMITKTITTGVLGLSILAQSAVISNASFAASLPTDISGHWSESFVTSLVNQGVISGYPDGTFKPDKAISSSEFLSLILKAIGETPTAPQVGESWDTPIIKLAIEKGIIKQNDEFALSNKELTREETAYILYNTLSQKEGFTYDQCYTPILDQVIFDHESISTKYRDAVYSMLQKGVLTGNQNYFYPSQTFNRGGACVVIERVMDKEKRANPEDVCNGLAPFAESRYPKLSSTPRVVPFVDGKPVINEETDFAELQKHTRNLFSNWLRDYYDYEGYINSEWKSPYYQTYEKKKEAVDEYYDTAANGVNVLYNFSYEDLATYEKDLKYYKVSSHKIDEWINNRLTWISNKTVSMESYFVTDKSLFYLSSDNKNRTRGRLYFIFHLPSQEAIVEDVSLKVNQWYYVDFEVKTSQYMGQSDVEWTSADVTLGGQIYLSDFIPLEPLN